MKRNCRRRGDDTTDEKKDSKEVAMKRKEEKYDVEASGNMAGEVSTEVVKKKYEDVKNNQKEESKEVTEKKCEDGVDTETLVLGPAPIECFSGQKMLCCVWSVRSW